MSNNSGHRYREIANSLLADIRGGRYPVGTRIPTEHAISQTFSVSRNTARHAVQELERLGLITRQRGAGTVVVKTDPKPAFINSISSIGDLLQYAATTRLHVRRVRAALALPAIDGVQPQHHPQEWVHLEGIRYLEGKDTPLCSNDIFLHPDVADVAPRIGTSPMAVYRMIEQQHNLLIQSITQTIDGVVLSGDAARELGVREGSAGLKVIRAYNDFSDRTVEIAVNIYPAANFTYRMTILRNTHGAEHP